MNSDNAYIVLLQSKTMNDILGVYSTNEKANDACTKFKEAFNTGSSGVQLFILKKTIDEKLE